jgi:hypothetical protein
MVIFILVIKKISPTSPSDPTEKTGGSEQTNISDSIKVNGQKGKHGRAGNDLPFHYPASPAATKKPENEAYSVRIYL